MPRKPIEYSNTHFYKIVCKDTNIADCYVGHTTDFIKRKSKHKGNCNNPNDRNHNMPVYQFIRANGGFENFDMVLINTETCENSLEARRREREYIEQLGATLNKYRPFITIEEAIEQKKQYYVDNTDDIKQKAKTYYVQNREQCLDRNKKWRETHKEYMQEYQGHYYKENQDELKLYQKDYYKENKEYVLTRNKEWKQNNKEHVKELRVKYDDAYRERRKQLQGERISCQCGAVIRRGERSRHQKTKKHQSFLNTV